MNSTSILSSISSAIAHNSFKQALLIKLNMKFVQSNFSCKSYAWGKNALLSSNFVLVAFLSSRIMPYLLVKCMPLNAHIIWSLPKLSITSLVNPRIVNEKSNVNSPPSYWFEFCQPLFSNSSINLSNLSSMLNVLILSLRRLLAFK